MSKLEGIIFDLDETLIDSRSLKSFRDKRDWKSCYSNFSKTSLYESIDLLLNWIKDNSIKIGIVTMSPRPYAERMLKHHNIDYDVLIAYHDVKRRKPAPDSMELCASHLNLEKYNLISIGDDVRDMKASNAAGIHSIGVGWGNNNVHELMEAGASCTFESVNDLFLYLNEMKIKTANS